MEIISKKSNRMPGVSHDVEAGLVTINGEAYPEDVTASFEPIIESLSEILAGAEARPVEIRFELQYFNSGSSRKILEIIRLIETAPVAHKVSWVADPEDDEMIDHGNRFSRAVPDLAFAIVEEEL
jgi:hypothetical protein